MSILCAARPADALNWELGLLVGFGVLSLALMALYRVHILHRIAGPPRLALEQATEPLLLAMLIAAFTAYVAVPILYGTLCGEFGRVHQSHGSFVFSPNQKAVLQVLASCVGFLVLLVAGVMTGAALF